MSAEASTLLDPVRENEHIRGAGNPELTLVQYGDCGCPFCFAARRPLESLLHRYDSLALVWRHFPDPELHPGADLAAELSELAAVGGRFWEAHDLLLAGHERFTLEDLLSVAKRLGLDPAETEAALRNRTYRDRVMEDAKGGERAGVHGTPTFFVDGERLQGHWRQLAEMVPARLGKGR